MVLVSLVKYFVLHEHHIAVFATTALVIIGYLNLSTAPSCYVELKFVLAQFSKMALITIVRGSEIALDGEIIAIFIRLSYL